jgi:putative membrane protein
VTQELSGMPEDEGFNKDKSKGDLSTDLAVERTDMATRRTDMALARTSMAADRTLMSWVRTSLSLVSFGFTIYKFLTYLAGLPGVATGLANREGPQYLGIIMISASLLCTVLGMIEYYDIYKKFGNNQHQRLWGTSLIVAIFTALLSLLLLLAVITKIG